MINRQNGMSRLAGPLVPLAALMGFAHDADAEVKVAASIAPVHSLVAMVTEGITEPALIVRPGASPHTYAMKPSEAQALDQADVVIWIGEALEPWMTKAIVTLAGDASVVELGAVDGVTRLAMREGGDWTAHDHEDHGDDHQDRMAIDPHLWLDPDNAGIWLSSIAAALALADPENAEMYRANASLAVERLDAMTADIELRLAPVKKQPYIVFHDAYHYFERRFGLQPMGSVSLGDADRPGPQRILAIREKIAKSGAVCAFAEPQFEPKLLDTVIEGHGMKKGELDPIGAGLQPGPDLYPKLMQNLATSLLECLG
ncbi:MAG: zinc ABC transporter substrate-binding protein [Geminicoccaceae bacterium]